jgi:hypothetical protein
MSTYTIHSPISSRPAGRSSAAPYSSTVVAIAVCVMAALIAVAFLAAVPATSTHVKHVGHGAVMAATGQAGTAVASSDAAPVAAGKAATPVRPWRQTLHGRALVLSRSSGPAPANTVATGP